MKMPKLLAMSLEEGKVLCASSAIPMVTLVMDHLGPKNSDLQSLVSLERDILLWVCDSSWKEAEQVPRLYRSGWSTQVPSSPGNTWDTRMDERAILINELAIARHISSALEECKEIKQTRRRLQTERDLREAQDREFAEAMAADRRAGTIERETEVAAERSSTPSGRDDNLAQNTELTAECSSTATSAQETNLLRASPTVEEHPSVEELRKRRLMFLSAQPIQKNTEALNVSLSTSNLGRRKSLSNSRKAYLKKRKHKSKADGAAV